MPNVIQVSVGLVSVSVSDTNFDDIFVRADNALYQAKELGRNRVYIDPNTTIK